MSLARGPTYSPDPMERLPVRPALAGLELPVLANGHAQAQGAAELDSLELRLSRT
jgi:hypothetical protein